MTSLSIRIDSISYNQSVYYCHRSMVLKERKNINNLFNYSLFHLPCKIIPHVPATQAVVNI